MGIGGAATVEAAALRARFATAEIGGALSNTWANRTIYVPRDVAVIGHRKATVPCADDNSDLRCCT